MKNFTLITLFLFAALAFSSCSLTGEGFEAARAGYERGVELREEIIEAAEEAKEQADKAKADYEKGLALAETWKGEASIPAKVAATIAEIPHLKSRYEELRAVAEDGKARKLIDAEIQVFKDRMAEAEKNEGGLPPWIVAASGAIGTILAGMFPVLGALRGRNQTIEVARSAMRKTKSSVATEAAALLPNVKRKQSETLTTKEEAFVKSA